MINDKKRDRLDKVVVLNNTSSTHADRSKKLIGELKRLFSADKVHIVDITGYTPNKIATVIEENAKLLCEHTLLGIGGGDGTASSVAQAVVSSKNLSALNRKAILFPLWGGNANDLAVMLNGLATSLSLKKVINEGSTVKVHPLMVKITSPSGVSITRFATCYASFGATAEASWAMEQSSHVRGSSGPRNIITRMTKEFIDFWKTVLELDGFRIDHGKGVERTYERIFINGSRIARIPNTAVKLTDKKYLEATAKKKNLHLIRYAVDMFFRHKHGKVTDESQEFVINDATMAQIDGEIIGIEPNTKVNISIHKIPFYALSRKNQE